MKFTIKGKPVTWKRVKRGRYGQAYDPNVKRKLLIAQLAMVAKAETRSDRVKGDLMACMTFYLSDKRRCDLDNLIKIVMDALNGVVYDDDSQIIRIMADKQYVGKNEERTVVEVFPA